MPGPGQGRYTQYAAGASPAHDLVKKLFSNRAPVEVLPPQAALEPGAEALVMAQVVSVGASLLQAQKVEGNPIFPSGVNLDFTGNEESAVPNLAEVVWDSPGDPANPYFADLSSPGQGSTEGKDKDVDPKIEPVDIKPNYVPGGPSGGTRSPAGYNAKIIAANMLGVNMEKGRSVTE